MVYPSKKLIHVHPPKTGGQSIQAVLGIDPRLGEYNGIWRHDTLVDIYTKTQDWLDPYKYKVAMSVRHPGERLISFFYYVMFARTLKGDPTREYLWGFADISDFLRDADFDYLQDIEEGEAILRPLCYYARCEDVDIIWRLEEVGPLIPQTNFFFEHYSWEEVGGPAAARHNESLADFLGEDCIEFDYI